MKPLSEDAAAAAVRSVERAREAGTDSHHAARQRVSVGGLDQEVRMRGLQRVVNEAEVTAVARDGKAALDCTHERNRTQRRYPGTKLDRHVHGKARADSIAPAVRHARLEAGLAAGAGSTASPTATLSQFEVELRAASVHHQLE